MTQHLRYRGAVISPESRAGEFSADLLKLNDARSVRGRELYQDFINTLRYFINSERERVRIIERELKRPLSQERRKTLEEDKARRKQRVENATEELQELLCQNVS